MVEMEMYLHLQELVVEAVQVLLDQMDLEILLVLVEQEQQLQLVHLLQHTQVVVEEDLN
jgi:hypothetical protein